MPRIEKLPPPPDKPVRSPPVHVQGEEKLLLSGAAGAIEASLRAVSDPLHAIVICHPHPLYGGSMHSPVPLAIAKGLSELDRVAYLRFNFRGVGESEGAHDFGRGEVDDARVAIETLRARCPGASLALCGHSFGSWVGLRAAAQDGRIDRVALVGPSTRFFHFDAGDGRAVLHTREARDPRDRSLDARLRIFIGDADEFCDVPEARALADLLGAEIDVLEGGFDHHFMKSRRALVVRVLPFAPEMRP